MENTAKYLFNGQPVKHEFQGISVWSMKIYTVFCIVQKDKTAHNFY